MRYDTVLFDLDHTLSDTEHSFEIAFESTMRSIGIADPANGNRPVHESPPIVAPCSKRVELLGNAASATPERHGNANCRELTSRTSTSTDVPFLIGWMALLGP